LVVDNFYLYEVLVTYENKAGLNEIAIQRIVWGLWRLNRFGFFCFRRIMNRYEIIKTIPAGKNGTKKLFQKYGEVLLCVRYRIDNETGERIKTAEIIVEREGLLVDNKSVILQWLENNGCVYLGDFKPNSYYKKGGIKFRDSTTDSTGLIPAEWTVGDVEEMITENRKAWK